MATRLAVLILSLVAAAACEKAPAEPTRDCGGCHAVHYVREGTCRDCHRGEPATSRRELAHGHLLSGAAAAHRLPDSEALREGQALVEALACRRCHTVGGEGNTLATNLDRVVWKREQEGLVASITEPVESMPRFGLARGQAAALVGWLLRGGDSEGGQDAYRVHFAAAPSQASVFERLCGGCHRVLTARGPLGSGGVGPNLSGLFTSFYPRTALDGRPWSDASLSLWLRNPRAVRRVTLMPPVRLDERSELPELLRELGP